MATKIYPACIDTDGRFHAVYPDFQGNIRAVACGGEIKQVNHYYPYGLPFAEGIKPDAQPYSSACRFAPAKNYGAKELITDANLNLYDFHARFYDPVVPSWSRNDSLCEDNQWQSPLGYCSANPIGNIDPTGLYTISNVKGDTDYTVIVILRDPDTENEKQKAANGENIPLKLFKLILRC